MAELPSLDFTKTIPAECKVERCIELGDAFEFDMNVQVGDQGVGNMTVNLCEQHKEVFQPIIAARVEDFHFSISLPIQGADDETE